MVSRHKLIVCFCFRLRGAGLLTLCRLVEGGNVLPLDRERTKLHLDRSLLTALVDRWRPETHTFHLPCGEMAPTLQDVAFLLGLPIIGDAVGPRVIPSTWMDDLEARFANVQRVAGAGDIEAHARSARGPSKKWLLQFSVRPI
jgi:Plant mobile domain